MLNYIWLSLIVAGIAVAIGIDLHNMATNRFHAGEEIPVEITVEGAPESASAPTSPCLVAIDPDSYLSVYGSPIQGRTLPHAELVPQGANTAILRIGVDGRTPPLWREIFEAQRNPEYLLAHLRWDRRAGPSFEGRISFDPVRFVKMTQVTNEGIFQAAKTAVELSIGLIGIMAFWLGVMKVAEASGLAARLGSLLKPVTRRLFPDVPPDHPAMSAMIMNISANILGLANAATPLGLKAMEELNKLNRRAGTATDAMCTFLVINTSNVQIIPATVIAIRAAAGSASPAEIIGPVILVTALTLVVGVTTVKILGRMRMFRLETAGGEAGEGR